MHIFLTGSSGFIGGHFLRYVLKKGLEVTTVNRKEIKKINKKHKVIKKKLNEIVPEDLKGIDTVMHLASAGVSPKKASFLEVYETNILSSVNLMKCAIKSEVKRFISAGTSYEYGVNAKNIDKVPPNYPLQPYGYYAESKASCFYILKNLAIENNLIFLYPRIFSAYGIGQYEKNFWPSLYYAAKNGEDFLMSKGDQIYDFIEVGEVVKYLYEGCIRNDINNSKIHIYNIGSGIGTSLYDFARSQWSLLEGKGKIKRGAISERDNQITKLVADLEGLEIRQNKY